MAKNLRQKYKEAKRKLREMNWRLMYPDKPMTVNNVSIRKVRSAKTVDILELENMREAVMTDIAFDLAKYMVENDMVNVSETYDPFSGKAYVFADINIVDA